MARSKIWKQMILGLAAVVSAGLIIVSTGCNDEVTNQRREFKTVEDMEEPVRGSLAGAAEIKTLVGPEGDVLKMVPGSWFTTELLVPEYGGTVVVEWMGIIRPDTKVNITARTPAGMHISRDFLPMDARSWQRTSVDLSALRGFTVELTLSMTGGELPSEILVRHLETGRASAITAGTISEPPGVIGWMILTAIGVSIVVIVTSAFNLVALKKVPRFADSGDVGTHNVAGSNRIEELVQELLQKTKSIEGNIVGQATRDEKFHEELRNLLELHDHNIGLQGQVLDRTFVVFDKLEEVIDQSRPVPSPNGKPTGSRL